MRKTPRVLRVARRKNLGVLRVADDRRRAKLVGFAPGMWDPRNRVQNAKLFVNEVTVTINVACVASQVLASKQLSTCVAKNRLHDKTTAGDSADPLYAARGGPLTVLVVLRPLPEQNGHADYGK
jgi:hypothetical protein